MQIKSYFNSLSEEVEHGIAGRNEGISFGFPRLDNYVTLRKASQYLFGGFTGSAKTSTVDSIFVLNPIDTLMKKGQLGKLRVIYWSMERRKNFKLARWFSRKCFLDEGVKIPLKRLLGWVKKEERLTKDEHDLYLSYESYFDQLQQYVTILDGRQNPTGIRKYIRNIMEGTVISSKNGQDVRDTSKGQGIIHQLSEYHSIYEPNDPNTIWLNIFDHAGKIRKEKGMTTEKDTIDHFSNDVSNYYRDFFGMSSVIVSQFNRSISNPMRLKAEDVTPMLEDFKSTSDLAEDSDVVMSIFDPYRYKVVDPSGYNLSLLRGDDGAKYYRNLQILKNSFGPEDVRIGLAYQPELGILKEMPRKPIDRDLSPEVYQSITNSTYFLEH